MATDKLTRALLTRLVRLEKARTKADDRAYESDTRPGFRLRVGYDGKNWQYWAHRFGHRGPNVGFPHWAEVGVYRDSKPADVVREVFYQLTGERKMRRR